MDFKSSAQHYDRFMGRYAIGLAPSFADAAGVAAGMMVLDVGCGPGALTDEISRRVGPQNVAAIDPAPQFAEACAERNPGADVRVGVAEELPWDDGSFDVVMSSLVVAFMRDADLGIREMARVTRPGGKVAACMWDIRGGGMKMLSTFWAAAHRLDPSVGGEERRPGVSEGDLADRFRRAGLTDVAEGAVETSVDYADFNDYWEPFTHAVGRSGQFLAKLDPADQAGLREELRSDLPEGPFTLAAKAWYAEGTTRPT